MSTRPRKLEPRNPHPRIHEVHNRSSKYVPPVRTDYDQRLWPPPGKTYEKTIEEALHKAGKKTVRK